MALKTVFGSIDKHEKGGVEITGNEEAKDYLFSNMFEVASNATPWERIVIAKNLEHTVECIRAEGESPWYICAHDETALLMQGAMETYFIKPTDAAIVPGEETEGSIKLDSQPEGSAMGHVKAGLGHLTLLPAGAAYQFRASELGVILLQTLQGDESVEKWADICQH
jgi:hypothetical protein